VRVTLSKSYGFEAAHHLPRAPQGHKCRRVHGHSFVVEVHVAGEVDPELGWLIDFGEISARVEPLLKNELDHRLLNDVPGLENPTSEMLCAWLWERLKPALPALSEIVVHETCAARCAYRGT